MGKADDTKKRVERAALTLFMARGVAETTTREIAMAASVAEGTIYRYFPSKDALALELFTRHHVALAEALLQAQAAHKKLRQKCDAIVRCYCEWADRDWITFAYHLLTQHHFLASLSEDLPNPVDVVSDVIAQAMAAGEIPRRDLHALTASVVGVVLQAATFKVYGRINGPLIDQAPLFSDAAWAILSAKPS